MKGNTMADLCANMEGRNQRVPWWALETEARVQMRWV